MSKPFTLVRAKAEETTTYRYGMRLTFSNGERELSILPEHYFSYGAVTDVFFRTYGILLPERDTRNFRSSSDLHRSWPQEVRAALEAGANT